MNDNNYIATPIIAIDLARNCVRIFKKTLHALGSPEYILLIVNPKEKTLGVLCADKNDQKSHRVDIGGKQSCEIYSNSFVQKLKELCNEWDDGCVYRLTGELIRGENMARFHMSKMSISSGR